MTDLLQSLNKLLPTYETVLPFSQKQITFVPFRVRDAKTVSVILQEDNKKLALKIMVELLKANTKGASIEDLYLADAEFLFLQIRSKSVEEVLNLLHNNERIQVNINDIKHRNNPKEEIIDVGNHIHIHLQTPKVKDLLKLQSLNKEELMKACIKKIVVKKEVFDLDKYVDENIQNILNDLPLSVVPKIDKFLKEQPELYLTFTLEDNEKEVTGLLNFFIYR